MQPDIEEEDEIDLDIKECEAVEQPENADGEAAHDGTGQRTESECEQQQCFVRLWVRIHLSLFPSQSF
jgi:hypothetical protein